MDANASNATVSQFTKLAEELSGPEPDHSASAQTSDVASQNSSQSQQVFFDELGG